MKTYGKNFWKQATERAIKTAAQAALLALGGDVANAIPGLISRPGILLGALGGGALLSYLTSLVTAGVGPKDDPSAVTSTPGS
jgi:hypothetical protein